MSARDPEQTLDEYLVLACRCGEPEAFTALHRRWQARLKAHAAYLLGSSLRDHIADIGQEAWLAIADGIARLEDARLFRAWAYSIVTRRVADLRRRLERDRVVGRQSTADIEESAKPAAPLDDQTSQHDALRRALDALPGDDRALLRLFYLDELSVAETAAALAVPVGTVKSRLFHARRRLRQAMQRMTT